MATITEADLRQFTGTEQWFRHGLVRSVLYTEGVQFLAENAGAYWLVDKIATLQLDKNIVERCDGLQCWKLTVADRKATLVCTDGNDENPVHSEQIEFTDFPLETVSLWVEENVILLPSEH